MTDRHDGEEGHRCGAHEHDSTSSDPDASERQHFLEVCYSCLRYREDASRDIARFQALGNSLEPEDRALWKLDPKQWVDSIGFAIEMNARFLQLLPTPDVCGAVLTDQQAMSVCDVPDGHHVASRNSSKVRTTLRQFVRDWAVEGQAERDATYTPLMQALQRHLPVVPGRPKPRVLCPGSGLGRLPFDLARLGYAAQGNEFSYHMILGSHLIYNRTERVGCHVIFPYILSTVNLKTRADNMRPVNIPDVVPCLSLTPQSEVSMAAGEFVAVYERQVAEWDAVATAFFLDTAKNPVLYIRTIADIIRPGGVWANLGPLLYHFADVEDEVSVELSWEELRPCICKYFDIVEEERRVAHYTLNQEALMRTVYRCVFFVARRNDRPTSGQSNPVY